MAGSDRVPDPNDSKRAQVGNAQTIHESEMALFYECTHGPDTFGDHDRPRCVGCNFSSENDPALTEPSGRASLATYSRLREVFFLLPLSGCYASRRESQSLYSLRGHRKRP